MDILHRWHSSPNRYVCSVIDEMRKSLAAFNQVKSSDSIHNKRKDDFVTFMGLLVEEAQTLVNRMEAALSDWSDIRYAHDKLKELEKEIENKQEELNKLTKAVDKAEKKKGG